MRSYRRYDSEVQSEVLRRFQAGESSGTLSEEFGASASTIRGWVRARGIKPRRKSRRRRQPELVARDNQIQAMLLDHMSVPTIAEKLGVTRYTVYGVRRKFFGMEAFAKTDKGGIRVRGVITPEQPVKVGRGITLGQHERIQIAFLLRQGQSHHEIAQALGRCQSTISREIRRNSSNGFYDSGPAHSRACQRRKRPQARKIDTHRQLRSEVKKLLLVGSSPQQIAYGLRHRFPDNKDMQISHEAIYQALYVQGVGSLRQELKVEKALRSGRTSRIPKSKLAGVTTRGRKSWVHGAEISTRPPEIEDRAVPGHWEGDLVIGKGQRSAIITLVERRSRLVLIRRLPLKHDSPTVIEILKEMIASVPGLLKTITWDQGSEMANVADLKLAHPIDVYFADPHSPWQRGTNERTNRDIRWYFPKGTDFADITDEQILEVQSNLNSRPRVVLNGKTPLEELGLTISDAITA